MAARELLILPTVIWWLEYRLYALPSLDETTILPEMSPVVMFAVLLYAFNAAAYSPYAAFMPETDMYPVMSPADIVAVVLLEP